MTSQSNDLIIPSRAAQRKQRLLEIENEQRKEDAEALKMTEEQRQILLQSFTSVKVEFSDLDGLSWNVPLEDPCSSQRERSRKDTFVVLTNADLASFSPHETIRASAASRPRPRSYLSSSSSSPTQNPSSKFLLSARHSSHHSYLPVASSLPSLTSRTQGMIGNHKSSRSRSSVKGLFSTSRHDSYNPHIECLGQESDVDEPVRHDGHSRCNTLTPANSPRGLVHSGSRRSSPLRISEAVRGSRLADFFHHTHTTTLKRTSRILHYLDSHASL